MKRVMYFAAVLFLMLWLPACADAFAPDFPESNTALDERFLLAHSGMLSSKDNCHKDKKAGERHWHIRGSQERGGPCLKFHGKTWKFGQNTICAKERVDYTMATRSKKRELPAARKVIECLKNYRPPSRRRQ